jgi:sec-independent protein translocase protein TatB
MLDFGFDKLALIGVVSLIVIGPERLPRVARTVGALLGKAQRYVADVKAEVNRQIELEQLQKMKAEFEDGAREVHNQVQSSIHELQGSLSGTETWRSEAGPDASYGLPSHKPPRKRWRVRQTALPQWYKQRQGVKTKVQSGAARVKRFRPAGLR